MTAAHVPPVISMGIARFGAPLVGFVDLRLGRDSLFASESVRALRTYRHIDHAKAPRTFGYMPCPTCDTIEDIYRWFAEAGVIEGVRASRLGARASLRAWWGSVSRKGVHRQSV